MEIRESIKELTILIANILSGLKNNKVKIIFILNYHRIGPRDAMNPFHMLHTVSEKQFRLQINFLSTFGNFVSLDDVYSGRILSKINFSITFDDVSKSVLKSTKYLESKSIPYAIGPSVKITEDGLGWRDKVYFILKNYEKNKIFSFVKNVLDEDIKIDQEKFSFYHFSKSNNIESSVIERDVIQPLFEKIDNIDNILLEKSKQYLEWQDYRNNYVNNDYATIMNHSVNHYNMSTFSRAQVFEEIQISTKKLKKELGIIPKYFAVPFGTVTGNLLVDLNNAAWHEDYKGVLWVTNGANIAVDKMKSQMLHLSRIHAPENFLMFLKTLIFALKRTHRSITNYVDTKTVSKNKKLHVNASNKPDPALSAENLLRYGKDYASDSSYYNYSFSQNIFRTKRPDYYFIGDTERLESIGYNFHTRFKLLGKRYDGIYWAGWRKLPFTAGNVNAMLLLKAMQNESIIGSYKPNQEVQKAFQSSYWKKILIHSMEFDVRRHNNIRDNNKTSSKNIKIRRFSQAPEELKDMIKSQSDNIAFSLERSLEYYQWRYDNYPLAKTEYFILYRNQKPMSYFVVLYKNETAFISDFICSSKQDFLFLFINLMKFCSPFKIKTIGLETSSKPLALFLQNSFEVITDTFHNYYYFNKKHLKDQWDEIESCFDLCQLHETQTTGDVLIK